MIYRLARPLRQLLALALLVVAVGAVCLMTIVPLASKILDQKDRIEYERTVLGRLNSEKIDDVGSVDSMQQAISNRIGGLAIPGESESIRIAAVQSQLMELLGRNNVKPRSSRNLPGRDRSGLRLVGLQVQLTAQIENLQAALLAIEAHKPYLFVDAMHVTVATVAGSVGEDIRGLLDVRLDVFGVEYQPKGP